QNGRLAAALRNGGSENGTTVEAPDEANSNGNVGPLIFFRMFRFGTTSQSNGNGSPTTDATRMVPVIIVGIRSVTPRDGNPRDNRPSPPSLEALSNIPSLSDSFDSLPNNTRPDRHTPARRLHPPWLSQRRESSNDTSDDTTSPTST